MDELDMFWVRYFHVTPSKIERELLFQIMETVGPEDPQFVLPALQIRQIYLALDDKAKGVLEFGPAITQRIQNMQSATSIISSDLLKILKQIARVKRNIVMLDAHLMHQNRSVAQRVMERAIAIVDSDSKTSLQWSVGLGLSFISGVAAVCIWTP